ncbi:Protein T2 [Irineochytrium annulatum]|nr:Protein T2 [Irineochytrium annulatum]
MNRTESRSIDHSLSYDPDPYQQHPLSSWSHPDPPQRLASSSATPNGVSNGYPQQSQQSTHPSILAAAAAMASVGTRPVVMEEEMLPRGLDPPLLRSPLYSADAMVLLAPHLIDAISGSLPSDAWEYMSIPIPAVAAAPSVDSSVPNTPEYHLIKDGIRGYAVLEILTTERNYYKELGVIKNICKKRLEEREILSRISINKIFAGMEDLYDLHTSFLAMMEELLSADSWAPSETSIGTLFLEYKEQMAKYYIVYINNYSSATKTMSEEETNNPEFKKFLIVSLTSVNIWDEDIDDSPQECTKSEEVKHGLKDLLVRPMQRMTKYPLLIRELDKKTADNHPDSANIKNALEAMSSLATTVNDKMAEMVMLISLFKAHDVTLNCPPTLLTSRRRCIISIDAMDRSNRHLHLFLCSDLIMVVTVQRKVFGAQQHQYKFLRWLDLLEVTLEDLGNDWARITLSDENRRATSLTTPGFSNLFEFKIDGQEPGSRRMDFIRSLQSELRTVRKEAGLPPLLLYQ